MDGEEDWYPKQHLFFILVHQKLPFFIDYGVT